MKLYNKISVITGAGQGIGRAIAIKFAKEGSYVVVNNVSFDKALSVSKEIEAIGGRSYPIQCDVSSSSEVNRMINIVIEKFGHIDILVNNAGIQTLSPFIDIPLKDWSYVLDVNLRGAFLCSQLAAKHMVKCKNGKIINILSIHNYLPRANKIPYDVSKAGLTALTKETALELAKYNINVNGIAPGAIETPMNKDILKSEDKLNKTVKRIPWGRLGKPEEVANLALFLASNDSDYITGTIIKIDGGSSLRYHPPDFDY